jgi:hypothetical protein
MGLRSFWLVMGVACLVLALAAVVAIASGGYHPERYAGSLDPIRSGLLVAFGAFTLAFALLARATYLTARVRPDTSSDSVVLAIGLAITAGALFALVAWMPAAAGSFVLPLPLRIVIFLGPAIMILGLAHSVMRGRFAAATRFDRGLAVGVLLVAVVVVFGFITRE